MAKATVVISAKDRLSPGLLEAKKSLLGFQDNVSKVGNTLKTALGLGSAVIAIKSITNALTSSFNAFNEADRKYKQLKLTLGDGEAFQSVSDKIKELQKITLSSKADIESMVSQLAGLGKSADEINAISDAVVALSNVTGKDLNSSLTTLLATYSGSSGKLEKLIPEVGELTKAELEQGAAIDLVSEKLGGLSREMAQADTTQAIKNIKDTVGDLSQVVGGVINSNLGGFIQELDTKLTEMYGDIEYVIRYIGVSLTQLPAIASITFDTMIKMAERLFTFDTLKSFVSTVVTSLLKALMNVIENLSIVISHVVEFVVLEIQYIANNLYMELVNAIYDFFDSTENMFKDSWLGKLIDFATKASGVIKIGIGGALAASDIAAGRPMNALSSYLTTTGTQEASGKSIEEATEAIKNAADTALESAVDALKSAFSSASEDGSNVLSATGSFLTNNFSDIITDFQNAVNGLVVPLLEGSGSGSGSGGGGGGDDDGEEKPDFLGGVLDKVYSALGDAGSAIKDVVANITTFGGGLGVAMTAITQVLEGVGKVIAEPLMALFNLIFEPLQAIGEVLGNIIVPVLGAVAPFLKLVSVILEALTPVLKVFGTVVVAIAGTIEYVGQALHHWVATLLNWLASLNLLGWRPFAGLRTTDPGSPGSYSGFMRNRFDEFNNAIDSVSTSGGTTTGTSIASAGYQGATSVTINIYQQSPVVGSNGMREFASMIRDEFENLNYYGVTV